MRKNRLILSVLSTSILATSFVGVTLFSIRENRVHEATKQDLSRRANGKGLDIPAEEIEYPMLGDPGFKTAQRMNVPQIKEIMPDIFDWNSKILSGTGFSETGISETGKVKWRNGGLDWSGRDSYGSNAVWKIMGMTGSGWHQPFLDGPTFNEETDLFIMAKEEGDTSPDYNHNMYQSHVQYRDFYSFDRDTAVTAHPSYFLITAPKDDLMQIGLVNWRNDLDSTFQTVLFFEDWAGRLGTRGATSTPEKWLNSINNNGWNQGFQIESQDLILNSITPKDGKTTIEINGVMPFATIENGPITELNISTSLNEGTTWHDVGTIPVANRRGLSNFSETITSNNINTSNQQRIRVAPNNANYSSQYIDMTPYNQVTPGTLSHHHATEDIEIIKIDDFVNGQNWLEANRFELVQIGESTDVITSGTIDSLLNNRYIPLDLTSPIFDDNEMINVQMNFYNDYDPTNNPDGHYLKSTNFIQIDPNRETATGDLTLIDMFDPNDINSLGKVTMNLKNLILSLSVNEVRVMGTDLSDETSTPFVVKDPTSITNTDTELDIELNLGEGAKTYNIYPEFGYTDNDGVFVKTQSLARATDWVNEQIPPTQEDWTTWGTLYRSRVMEVDTNYIDGSILYNPSQTTEDSLSISGSFNIGNNEFGQYKGDETFALNIIANGETKVIEQNLLGDPLALLPGEKNFEISNKVIDLEALGLETNIEYDLSVSMTTSSFPLGTEVWTDKITFEQAMLKNPSIDVVNDSITDTSAKIKTTGFSNGSGNQRASRYELELVSNSGIIDVVSGSVSDNDLIISLGNLTENTAYSYNVKFYEKDSTSPIVLESDVKVSGDFTTLYTEVKATVFDVNSVYDQTTNILKVTWDYTIGKTSLGEEVIPENFDVTLNFKDRDPIIVSTTLENKEIIIELSEYIPDQGNVENGFDIIIENPYGEDYINIIPAYSPEVVKTTLTIAGLTLIIVMTYLALAFIKNKRKATLT